MTSSFDPSIVHRATAARASRRLGVSALLGALLASACTSGGKSQALSQSPEPATGAEAAPTSVEPAAGAEPASPAAPAAEAVAPSVHAFRMKRLDGTEASLADWSGKVLLIVNTASKCGYTPQYQGLQELHTKYSPRGFEVLGFPSNDFGGQEPGTSEEIAQFCISMYDVNFPMFEKTKVVGEGRSELYALLSEARGAPQWNFHKYLVDKRGRPVQAWPSKVVPGSPEITSAIEAQLAAP